MSASAALSRSTLQVTPGEEAVLEVKVRNTGTVVDELRFEIKGDAAPWATVEPLAVSLLPEGEATATVRFAPPATPAPAAGPLPFAVAVSCKEDPDGGVAEEGTVEVLVRSDLSAELIPRTQTAAALARTELAVDNRGNAPVRAELSAVDPNSALKFGVDPTELQLEPGTASFARLDLRPARRFWWGPDQTRPYSIVVIPEEGAPCQADGTYVQRAVIPRWAPKALAGAIAAILALALVWAFLIDKAIDDHIADALADAGITTTTAVRGGGKPSPSPTTIPGTAPNPADAAAGGTPVDVRLTPGAAPYTPPAGAVLRVTDLVFSNLDVESGVIRLLRNDAPVLELNLANFRDLDYHFVTPLLVAGGQGLRVELQSCSDGGTGGCARVAVLVNGRLA